MLEPHPAKPGKYRIVGIDNDHAFVPAIVKETPDRNFWGKVIPVAQVKTILYCLEQMKDPVDPDIRALFINARPYDILEDWLRELKKVHHSYNGLFTDPAERNALFINKNCFIGVPFQKGAVYHLYDKFIALRNALSQNPSISHIGLLEKLEPRLAKRYRAALLIPGKSIGARWAMVDAPFYEKKGGNSTTTLTRSGDILKSMDIPLKESVLASIQSGKDYSPMQALEELREVKGEIDEKTLEGLGARARAPHILQTLKLEETRAKFLEGLDFAAQNISLQEQEAIIEYLGGKSAHALSFKNAVALNDGALQRLTLGHLKKLDIRGCLGITWKGLLQLSQTALGLEELNLSGHTILNNIGNISVFTNIPLVFEQLRWLNLNGCKNLTMVLLQASELQWLSCQGMPLEDQVLYRLLIQAPKLRHVDLTGCEKVTKGARAILPAFLDPTLTSLDLEDNSIGDAEVQVLARNTSLTSLNLRGNQIGDAGAQALAASSSLKVLYLGGNQVRYAGAQALASNSSLKLLDLAWNQVGDAGAQALAANSSLTSLNLGGNQVGNAGALVLAGYSSPMFLDVTLYQLGYGVRPLAAISPLKVLHLWGNQISDNVMWALAGNSSLTSLNLNGNKIGDAGAQALAQNTTLTSLNLYNNKVGAAGKNALRNSPNLNLRKLG